jgi:hypothetical protein
MSSIPVAVLPKETRPLNSSYAGTLFKNGGDIWAKTACFWDYHYSGNEAAGRQARPVVF